MNIQSTAIREVKIITPKIWHDQRGYFFESFNSEKFSISSINYKFMQDNEARSEAGVIRGLHYQVSPNAQTKLVRVVHGAVLDVAVDIRMGSPTFGKHVSVELSAENKLQLLIPAGFAHGYISLVPGTVFLYKVDEPYSPGCERGLYFGDPALGINWSANELSIQVSEKDLMLPRLKDIVDTGFRYALEQRD